MTSQTLGAAPGWYPDGHGAIRYFDGTAWTQHTHTGAAAPAAPAAAPPQQVAPAQAAVEDEPFYKQGWFFVDVAFLALIVAIIVIAAVT